MLAFHLSKNSLFVLHAWIFLLYIELSVYFFFNLFTILVLVSSFCCVFWWEIYGHLNYCSSVYFLWLHSIIFLYLFFFFSAFWLCNVPRIFFFVFTLCVAQFLNPINVQISFNLRGLHLFYLYVNLPFLISFFLRL